MLGAYLKKKPLVSLDSVYSAILAKVGQKRAHLVDVNKSALTAGAEAVSGQQ
jgi:Pyruvate/2-oxoacid:ferredoxin oxidoreductase gamma subunit